MYIEVVSATKYIKGKMVLNNISLSLSKGKIYGFVGANGSGKTMLFRALCGFIKLDEGYVLINDKRVCLNQPLPEKTGLILEHPGFLPNISAFDNLKFLAEMNNNFNKEYIEELLCLFELEDVKLKKVKTFSLGMIQKLGIIQAVMENQDLIILDEPTNGLDKKSVETFITLIKKLKIENKTILIASHHDYEIKNLADTIFTLENGQLA